MRLLLLQLVILFFNTTSIYAKYNANTDPISITTQPFSVLECEGHLVTFKVLASGSDLTYSWQRKKPKDSIFTTIPS
ncbi:MAG: hypothetical protein ABI554_05210, partial [Flavobacterium sp.]